MGFIYQGSYSFKYFIFNYLTDEFFECTEKDFFDVVGFDRDIVPMSYDEKNINRQNYFMDGFLIAYRIRVGFRKELFL